MSKRDQLLRWDEGDPLCDHGPFVIYQKHVYCAECARYMSPTRAAQRVFAPRPAVRWEYVQETLDGDLIGVLPWPAPEDAEATGSGQRKQRSVGA